MLLSMENTSFHHTTHHTALHLIVNPVAGRGRTRQHFTEVKHFFEARALPCHIHETSHTGHATAIAKELPKDVLIASLGGDGTLHEVASACIHSERSVAVIPTGSGDDFAFALGINSIDEALQAIVQGRTRYVDTGKVESYQGNTLIGTRHFINTLGVGFDAEVGDTMRQLPHLFKGQVAYITSVLMRLFRLHNIVCEVIVDGKPFYQGPSLLISIQNGPRTGGSFYLTPHARVDDGLFDVIVAGRIAQLGALMLLPKTLTGKLVEDPQVFRTRGKEVEIHCRTARVGHTEGEFLASATSFKASVQPASLKMVIP